MILFPLLVVFAVLIAFLARGVPDMRAADAAVAAAKEAAGDDSISLYDIAAFVLKCLIYIIASIAILYALAVVGLAIAGGAL